jgi:hypothetical protein
MNGDSGKGTASNKGKPLLSVAAASVAAAANTNGNKKRKKDLKPIITGEGQQGETSAQAAGSARR